MFYAVFNIISLTSQERKHLSIFSFSSFLQVLHTIFFPSHWLPSHITIVEQMDSCERKRNLVAQTITNPRKEYWPNRESNSRPRCKHVQIFIFYEEEDEEGQEEKEEGTTKITQFVRGKTKKKKKK